MASKRNKRGRHISTVPDAAVEDGGSDVLEGGDGALVPRAALDEEAVRDVRGVVDAQPDGDDQVVARHLENKFNNWIIYRVTG